MSKSCLTTWFRMCSTKRRIAVGAPFGQEIHSFFAKDTRSIPAFLRFLNNDFEIGPINLFLVREVRMAVSERESLRPSGALDALPTASRAAAQETGPVPFLPCEYHRERMHPGDGAPAIEIRDLRKVYGDKAAVDGLTLTVPQGCFFGFLGPNGAGKTTTVKMLMGLATPTSGSIQLLGLPMPERSLEIKQQIGLVPDESMLFDHLTGGEFIEFVGRIYGLERGMARARADELLDLFELGNMPKKLCFGFLDPKTRKRSRSWLSCCVRGRQRRSRATALGSSAAVRQNPEPRKARPRT